MPADKIKEPGFGFPAPEGAGFPAETEPKLNLPAVAEVEKAYAKDNRAIEQCEDDALEALFGRPISGRLEDPQNANTLAKLNQLVEKFNATSARLEKIEKGCQLLSEGVSSTAPATPPHPVSPFPGAN